ncbi:hypothetical protein F0L68_16915 [Solihabitans fulvus]|uniref:Uncharacterized protein n=1 Tax=Solihabitans fulvus TaxID=1892852 RepID=A0A5B2XE84_9PSEU|nr:hypothetical protein [Solihabitans fulvus]KAA2261464.1 hypothetical protein F0L68_16915 [Solihabitans fulvus]
MTRACPLCGTVGEHRETPVERVADCSGQRAVDVAVYACARCGRRSGFRVPAEGVASVSLDERCRQERNLPPFGAERSPIV